MNFLTNRSWAMARVLCVVTSVGLAAQTNVNLLQIGNSYSDWNGLTPQLQALSRAAGFNETYTQITPGGQTLQGHWDAGTGAGTERGCIAAETYTAFVLQPQSTEYKDDPAAMKSYYKLFYDLGVLHNTPMYMFCYWHATCTPSTTEQNRIDSVFKSAADYCGPQVPIIPSGRALYNVRQACLKHEITGMDQFSVYHDAGHPSTLGQYINALTHFAVLYKQNPEGLPSYDTTYARAGAPGDKKSADFEASLKIQHVVWETVKAFAYSRVDTTQLPTAKVQADRACCALSTPVTFDASQSIATASATITGYWWNFGDGTAVARTASPATTHSYSTAGDFVVRVVVVQDNGRTASAYLVMKAGPQPPVAAFVTDASGSTSLPVTINFDASSSSDLDGSIASYVWDFGDGSAVQTVTQPLTSHVFVASGAYTVVLTVHDNSGATATASRRVLTGTADAVDTLLTIDDCASWSGTDNYYNYVFDILGGYGEGVPYWKFDLAAAFAHPVSITAAKLRFYYTDNIRPQTITANRTTDNWQGATLFAGKPAVGASAGSTSVPGAGWSEIDVTGYVASEYAGDKVVSFAINGSDWAQVCQTGIPNSGSTDKPRLIITSHLAGSQTPAGFRAVSPAAITTPAAVYSPALGLVLKYTLSREATVEVGLFDMQGRQVGAVKERALGSGKHTSRLALPGIGRGQYLVRLRVDGQSEYVKVPLPGRW
jgi:PKD repeat protein